MDDSTTHFFASLKNIISVVASALGIGTVIGFINVFIGAASAVWLVVQIYDHFKYKRPVLKAEYAKMKAANEPSNH